MGERERERVDRVGKILRACKRLEGFMREAKRERERKQEAWLCAHPSKKLFLPACLCVTVLFRYIRT